LQFQSPRPRLCWQMLAPPQHLQLQSLRSRSPSGVCPYLPGPGPAYIAQRVLTESLCGVCPSPRRGCAGRGGRCGCGNARGHAGNARGHVAALPAGGPTCLESLSPAGGLGGLAEASRRPRMSESPRMSPTRRLLAPSHAGRCSRTRIPCSIAVTPDMVMRI